MAYLDQARPPGRWPRPAPAEPSRIDWVDHAKGICIILVVMMHSTLGVEAALGTTSWLGAFVAWAQPFRMPDFFMIAALFLSRRIDADGRLYFDRKVLHFAYFYVLWVAIQFVVKAPAMIGEHGVSGTLSLYLLSFFEPFGTLWFIYMLAIFFVVTRLLRAVPWVLVFGAAALLEMAPIHTGLVLIDEFAARFVYFYAGYLFARTIFDLADYVRDHKRETLLWLAVWVVINTIYVYTGLAFTPGLGLVLGFAGAAAIVAIGTLLSAVPWTGFLRYCGENSIAIYLAFFFPMAVTRAVLIKLGVIADAGTIALLVTMAGVMGPVVLFWLIQKTGFGTFLFERPAWARLPETAPRAAPQRTGQTATAYAKAT